MYSSAALIDHRHDIHEETVDGEHVTLTRRGVLRFEGFIRITSMFIREIDAAGGNERK